TVTASQTRSRNGSWAYKYEVTSSGSPTVGAVGHDVRTMSGGPQTTMGDPKGRYLSGYYSFYAYIDAGYDQDAWDMILGWMAGVTGAPSPISHIELRRWNGTLQLMYVLKNCAVGLYPCPNIAGYQNSGGYYSMTTQSPAGIKAFPRNQWVHVAVYYKMAPQNGQVTVWQDGVKIIDLTAPTMNTFGGHSSNLTNTARDMMIPFRNYGGPQPGGIQRMDVDDFRVSDYLPAP